MGALIDAVRRVFDSTAGKRPALLHALFELEQRRPIEAVRSVLGEADLEALLAAGLARAIDEEVAPQVRITRFRGQVIASDRLGYRRHDDFVLGPGPAGQLLAAAVRPIEHGCILDLGCGPGTQALWLARPPVEAVGIDISDRALAFAAFNRELNQCAGAAFARGDFLTAPADPAFDEAFDLVVVNPPFVLAGTSSLRYRDRPLPGHQTTRVALERVQRALRPGGRGYVIGSWLDDGTGAWDATPRSWLRDWAGRAAVTRVSSLDRERYAAQWSRDLEEPARSETVATWVESLEDEGAARITTGIIAVALPRASVWRRRSNLVALDDARAGWPTIERALAG